MDRAQSPIRAGLTAAALWVGVEAGVLFAMGLLLIALSIPIPSGGSFRIERVTSISIVAVLGVMFRRRAERENLNMERLGYTSISRPIVVVGLAAAALLFLTIVFVSQPIDTLLFPEGAVREADFLRSLREGGWLAAALLLPGNSILTPIVEEYSWRGYVQTRLVQGLGLRSGVAVTAVLFTAKHVVADVSLFRLTTLLVASLALGLLRTRWGTTVSTIAHLCVNFVATSFVIGQEFVGESHDT